MCQPVWFLRFDSQISRILQHWQLTPTLNATFRPISTLDSSIVYLFVVVAIAVSRCIPQCKIINQIVEIFYLFSTIWKKNV